MGYDTEQRKAGKMEILVFFACVRVTLMLKSIRGDV